MDIFTTQLTRVVPVRIIPEELKVKALVKEGAVRPLSDKVQEFRGDEYLPSGYKVKDKSAQQQKQQGKSSGQDEQAQQAESPEAELLEPEQQDAKAKAKHLDIYV